MKEEYVHENLKKTRLFDRCEARKGQKLKIYRTYALAVLLWVG